MRIKLEAPHNERNSRLFEEIIQAISKEYHNHLAYYPDYEVELSNNEQNNKS